MGFLDKVKDAAAESKSGLAAAMPGAQAGTDVSPGTSTPAPAPASAYAGPRWDYETEVLTSVVGRDKLRTGDLDAKLKRRGDQGWELVSCNLDADLKGHRDGHLLIFKRPRA
jgi:hypothetical protein